MGVGSIASFAGYTVESVLGQGGMGTVYLARHPRLPRRVALKLLNREVSADPEVRRRFEQEGDVVARLDHPGIVGVYDRGTTDGHLWIAMQYIQGTDVAKLDPRSFAPDRALRIVGETAAALDHAHAHGVLHRDVKPANILLAQQEAGRPERAVLTDFGIARLLDSTTQLTATGTFSATLAYASPEQLAAEVVDHRADQYSLACTLFTLLAGRTPYASNNPGQVVAGHLSLPVPRVTGFRADLPSAVDEVLARAMAKNRDERFSSCGEFAAAAADALHGRPVTVARSAPTVRDSAPSPVVSQSMSPTWPPGGFVPQPQQQHFPPQQLPPQQLPPQQLPTAPRRTSKKPRIFAGIGAAVVLAIVLGYVQRDAIFRAMTSWDDGYREIAAAFPDLVSSSHSQPGWLGTDCSSGKYAQGAVLGISCRNKDTGMEFMLRKYNSEAEATSRVFSFAQDRSRDKVLTHPSDPTPVTVSTRPPTGMAADSTVYTRFPGDQQRASIVFELAWANHTADETFEQWWPQAPLGRG